MSLFAAATIRSLLFVVSLFSLTHAMAADTEDPYRYLEDVDGAASMQWVAARNAISTKELQGDAGYDALYRRLLAIYDSKQRIPAISKVGDWYYNFWRDADHVRGIMRRTTLDEYRKAEPAWETVIDVDALAASDRENWVWKGWDCRYPDYQRCIVYLSRGGGDATVAREYDLAKRVFIAADEGGFQLPEAKGSLSWIDADHVFAATDFGPGTLTDSGYPRIVKRWTRGTPLASAEEIYAGRQTDISVNASRSHVHIGDQVVDRIFVRRGIDFYSNETFHLSTRDGRDALIKLDLPSDAESGLWRDQILITLRKAWAGGTHGLPASTTYPAGALLAIDFERFMAGERGFTMLFTPGPRKSLGQMIGTLNHLLIDAMSDVQNHVSEWTLADGRWTSRAVDLPRDGTIGLSGVDEDTSDDYFVSLSNALLPTTLAYARVGSDRREVLKSLPSFFDASGMAVEQREARSADETRVPYIVVTPKGYRPDGRAPTILYGYGGFEISLLPRAYSAGNGAAWLERGGVFVVAGIRGGGEFGPDWHDAAVKINHQHAFDDFIAVAEDLIATKVSSPSHLGIMGGSNGGLLVGAVAMQRPDLFKAVVCQVPLLDMRRYNKLLAGASWMGEYGDPDIPAEWEYISKYSPYQNVFAERHYPRFLFTTSTRDDRVHPGHARKMAAKMLDQKHDLLYFENTEGGHAGAANNQQSARMGALEYTFMARELR
ncbi:MAG: prolyl oligopeptidase family serine peptidase [Burkholderiaceae bacterium]